MSVRSVEEQEQFFVDALGFRKLGVDGAYHRFEAAGGGPGSIIDLHHEPDRAPGSWGFGAGTFHHIAFGVENDEALFAQKALYEELGYTDASEVKDRFYFHSMYVRSPGGILVECTANVPGGFYQDEAPEELGTQAQSPSVVRKPACRDPGDARAGDSARRESSEARRPGLSPVRRRSRAGRRRRTRSRGRSRTSPDTSARGHIT